jgi:energy-coupling factor transport system substrate-specific component
MKEVVLMWKHTRMIILTALCAAIYAAVLIPFKGGIVLIPGVTEVRPANAFPVLFGLLFGPAGAWGTAIGNFIANVLGGTSGGVFEFVGDLANFYLAFVAYKMWGSLGLVPAHDMSPTVNTFRKTLAYIIISVVAACTCGIIIAWANDLLGITPFAPLATIIVVNNTLTEIFLGIPLLRLIYPRIKHWSLIWTDIMAEEEVSRGFARQVGAMLMAIGAIGGFVAGIVSSTGIYGQELFQFGAGEVGQLGVGLSVLPFLILIAVASFMLSGREQFVEDDEDEPQPSSNPGLVRP